MIRAGWALDYAQYSGGHYADEEWTARADGAGIWTANCVTPWEWRRR